MKPIPGHTYLLTGKAQEAGGFEVGCVSFAGSESVDSDCAELINRTRVDGWWNGLRLGLAIGAAGLIVFVILVKLLAEFLR